MPTRPHPARSNELDAARVQLEGRLELLEEVELRTRAVSAALRKRWRRWTHLTAVLPDIQWLAEAELAADDAVIQVEEKALLAGWTDPAHPVSRRLASLLAARRELRFLLDTRLHTLTARPAPLGILTRLMLLSELLRVPLQGTAGLPIARGKLPRASVRRELPWLLLLWGPAVLTDASATALLLFGAGLGIVAVRRIWDWARGGRYWVFEDRLVWIPRWGIRWRCVSPPPRRRA